MNLENKSLKQLKAQCWDLLSQLIRLENPTCEICEQKKSEAIHHIIPKARGNAVYFRRENLLAVCHGCHFLIHNKLSPKEIELIILRTKGESFQEVELHKNDIVKFKRQYFYDTINNYKKMIKELKNET